MAEEYQSGEQQSIDFRLYLGILFFRWQIIAVCFLYCLLGGVLYIQLSPKEYRTDCKVLIYRDPKLVVAGDSSPWQSYSAHKYILTSKWLRDRVVTALLDEWGEKIGNRERMRLAVDVRPDRRVRTMLDISIQSKNSKYAEAFLARLLEEHRAEWEGLRREARGSATQVLETELDRLEEKIRDAEEDLIEYQRLHDLARVSLRGEMEKDYLGALMQRRSQLTTELMLLESQYPLLEDENAAVISYVDRLTRETGMIQPLPSEESEEGGGEARSSEEPESSVSPLLIPREETAKDEGMLEEGRGWQDLRVRLFQLQEREKELAKKFQEAHPELRTVRRQIASVRKDLEVAAQIQLSRLRDRHKALTIQKDALEAAEYKWQAKNLLAMKRRAELRHIQQVAERYEKNYSTLYARLHDMRVSEELEAEHFRLVEPVETTPYPVWPDAGKILVMVLGLGVGSGLGLALVVQALDNKVQSIKDVERVLKIPFLGGVPFWVHSGLEKTIRPIVTEEHASGATEAYRALRTSLISSLKKVNEKIVIVTSADSREGKTLTVLNVAIMIAEMKKKVLLIDMDLRRGRLHRSLGMEREPGVTDILQNGGSLRDVVRETRIEYLSLIPTGASVDSAAELLQSSNLVNLLVEIQDDFDYVLIDTSPVLRVTDTVVIATHAPGVVVYIARVNHTPKPLIRYSLDMLQDARVLGLIMNSIEMHKISSLYYTYQYPNYAYYSNAYAYGYDHYYYAYDDHIRRPSRQPGRRMSAGEKARQSVLRWVRRTFLPNE